MDLINEILEGIEKSELSDTNYGIIKSENNDILQKIHHNNIKAALKKLNEYRFCDNVNMLNTGRYIRYIPLLGMNMLKLANGGIIINIKRSDSDILIICKNAFNRIFTVSFTKSIIFQKFTTDEKIILDAIKYLEI